MSWNPPAALQTQIAEIDLLDDELQALAIDTPDDLEFAGELLAELKLEHKKLVDQRTKITKPIRAGLKEVEDFFRPPIRARERQIDVVRSTIEAAHRRFEEERQLALAVAGAAAVEGDLETRDEAMEVAQETEVEKVEGLQFRETWDFEVEDLALVPQQYLIVMIDSAAVLKEVRKWKSECKIPGIRPVRKTSVASVAAKRRSTNYAQPGT